RPTRRVSSSAPLTRAGCQFYAGDIGAVTAGQETGRTAQAGAEIHHTSSFADAGSLGKRTIGIQSAVVILVVWKRFFRRNVIQMPSAGLEFGQNDLRRNWMALIKIDC